MFYIKTTREKTKDHCLSLCSVPVPALDECNFSKLRSYNSAALLSDHKPQRLMLGYSTFLTLPHCLIPSLLSSHLPILPPSQMISLLPIFLRKLK